MDSEQTLEGVVTECESGLAVPGLVAVAWLPKSTAARPLAEARTDDEGRFVLQLPSGASGAPLRLQVFVPPCRPVLDLDVSPGGPLSLEVPRRALRASSPSRSPGEVGGVCGVQPEAVELHSFEQGVEVRVEGHHTGGPIGAPALPRRTQLAILPLGAALGELQIDPGPAALVSDSVLPRPVQPPEADHGRDSRGRPIRRPREEVPPDEAIYASEAPWPPVLVQVLSAEPVGPLQLVTIEIRPVQWHPSTLELVAFPELEIRLPFDPDSEAGPVRVAGRHEAELVQRAIDLPQVWVARGLELAISLLPGQTPCVILTSGYRWPESVATGSGTRPPKASEHGTKLLGDPVAELERLAHWKTRRGTPTRVVTVEDILDGTHGDFTRSGKAQDLQEVLRAFLQFARAGWDTRYVLIGGDVDTVPMRRLAAGLYNTVYDLLLTSSNPPGDGRVWTTRSATVAKMQLKRSPTAGGVLTQALSGTRFDQDPKASASKPGWYCTTEKDFRSKSSGFSRLSSGSETRWVIIEGAAGTLYERWQWVDDDTHIPSDFYYASLAGPGYGGSHRDLDRSGNGLFGQFQFTWPAEKDLDGVNRTPDVSVGRVPLGSGHEARVYVDKLIAYERLRVSGATSLDEDSIERVLFGAEFWHQGWIWPNYYGGTQPDRDCFVANGATELRAWCDEDGPSSSSSHRLFLQRSSGDSPVPYDQKASATRLGWYFASDATFAKQSTTATDYVVVKGPRGALAGVELWMFDAVGQERATREKEAVRALVAKSFPELGSVSRLYSDHADAPGSPTVVQLAEDTMVAAFKRGQHFVSLTGHGGPHGCCKVYQSGALQGGNTGRPSIVFAESCSTAKPDHRSDSAGEVGLFVKDGGTLAWVGNARESWIGYGTMFERFFWSALAAYGRLGPAANLRLVTAGERITWTVYAQVLMGDPEVPIWTRKPRHHRVSHPRSVKKGATITVTVEHLGRPAEDRGVVFSAAWLGSGKGMTWYEVRRTDANGTVRVTLPSVWSSPSVEVTVVGDGFVPYFGSMGVTG